MGEPRRKLGDAEIADALRSLPGWSVRDGKLHRELALGDFARAWGFMTAVALEAQRLDHHPEWSNVYDRVRIDLVTHDLGGISTRDLALARIVEGLAGRFSAGGGSSP